MGVEFIIILVICYANDASIVELVSILVDVMSIIF